MPEHERVKIVEAIKWVDRAVLSQDGDRTVRCTLASMRPRPDIFCNGGDQTNTCIPEADTCRQFGIQLVDGLGDKIQSSSWLTGIK